MAFTYLWSDAISLTNKLIKGTPTSSIDALVCDLVNSEMYAYWPWQWTITSGVICTLTDGVQDYSPPAQVYRLMRARMVRTDTTPDQKNELAVRQTIAPDLVPRSYTSISSVSFEEGVGMIRLSSAVNVPTGTTLQIEGEWQTNPTKITVTSLGMFFPDQYLPVACEGLLYWYYKLNDDPRAGGKATNDEGRAVYTGQYAGFMASLEEMARAEDFPATAMLFPDDALGIGRSYAGTLNIFGNN